MPEDSDLIDDLYQEVILDHFRNPRCKGCLSNPDSTSAVYNPLCGDKIVLSTKLSGDVLSELGFTGSGCSISQASASMMSQICKGKKVHEVRNMIELFKDMMRGNRTSSEVEDALGDAALLEGVRKFSARVRCAMLAWEALENCLKGKEEPKPTG